MAITLGTALPNYSSSEGNSNFARGVIEYQSFTLPTSAANGTIFDYRGFSGGSIYVSGACTITWYSQPTAHQRAGTTPVAAGDATVAAITQVFAGEGIADFPVGLFGKPWICPVSDTGALSAIVSLKK